MTPMAGSDAARDPDSVDIVAARVILQMLTVSAHDTRAEIALKTGIEPARLNEILTGQSYPDLYEIAVFERAYQSPLWPGPEPSP